MGVGSTAEIQQKINFATLPLCAGRQITNLKMAATQLRSEGSDEIRVRLVKKGSEECQNTGKFLLKNILVNMSFSLIPD